MATKPVYELAALTWGKEEKSALARVIKSGKFTMGENVKKFEEQFASFFGRKYAVMANSGSSANLLGVAALFFRKDNPLKRGDEVIVPCISWATTFYPLHQYGLKLRFVDVDLETLNYNTSALEKAVTPATRMIVAVSILGNPCDFDPILALCKKHNLILFEDNCESLGARYKGRYTGSFGLISTFSTFFSHHIATMEGGLVTTDDKELYNLFRSLRNHGWTRDQEPDSPVYKKSDNDFYEAYR
ncbi:MAG: aminotransferase class I/II-fold pyridoxal phosphate-dependent enzyme, partial [Spirochaetia bacterium]|nr:aminotransferase class I/II-fold pyridoxal phosphate-dependent enzyme [Spirochaetia bacterium]